MQTSTHGPDDGKVKVTSRAPSDTLTESTGHEAPRPSEDLNVSFKLKGPIPIARSHDQYKDKLKEPEPAPSQAAWLTVPIKRLDPSGIIETARELRNNFKDDPRFKATIQRRDRESASEYIEKPGRYMVTSLALQACMIAGGLITAGAINVTRTAIAQDLISGANPVGTPALAFSALTSGILAAGLAYLTFRSTTHLSNRFNDKLTQPLKEAKADRAVWDKMEWAAVLITNINNMNPVFWKRGSASFWQSGKEFRISHNQQTVRDAAADVYQELTNQDNVIKDQLKDFQFDQKVDPKIGKGNVPATSEFLENLKERWLFVPTQLANVTYLVSAVGAFGSVVSIPTIYAHADKFSANNYGRFLGELAKLAWNSVF